MALLLVSQGVPMLLAGDEVLRTQRGNNNAYCQDNDIELDGLVVHAAVRARCCASRASSSRCASATRRCGARGSSADEAASVSWYGEGLELPDWDHATRRCCASRSRVADAEAALHVMINMSPDAKSLPLPDVAPLKWTRVVDTTRAPPGDVDPHGAPVTGVDYRLPAHGIAVFEARPPL